MVRLPVPVWVGAVPLLWRIGDLLVPGPMAELRFEIGRTAAILTSFFPFGLIPFNLTWILPCPSSVHFVLRIWPGGLPFYPGSYPSHLCGSRLTFIFQIWPMSFPSDLCRFHLTYVLCIWPDSFRSDLCPLHLTGFLPVWPFCFPSDLDLSCPT